MTFSYFEMTSSNNSDRHSAHEWGSHTNDVGDSWLGPVAPGDALHKIDNGPWHIGAYQLDQQMEYIDDTVEDAAAKYDGRQ